VTQTIEADCRSWQSATSASCLNGGDSGLLQGTVAGMEPNIEISIASAPNYDPTSASVWA
jgi:hypothetical protein